MLKRLVAVALVIALVANTGLLWWHFNGIRGEPEASARYYPAGTVAYGWLSLAPGGSQQDYMREFQFRLSEHTGYADLKRDIKENMDKIDIDSLGDWIGPNLSFGFLGDGERRYDPMEYALTIDVRDREAALRFVLDNIDADEERGSDFQRETLGDFVMWDDLEGDAGAYALSDDLLVYASTGNALYRVTRLVEAEEAGESLWDSEKFQSACKRHLPERFASFYLDNTLLLETMKRGLSRYERAAMDELWNDGTAQWSGASAHWREEGIETLLIAPSEEEGLARHLEPRMLDEGFAERLPSDTVFALGLGFDPSPDNLRAGLSEIELAPIFGIASNGVVSELLNGSNPLEDHSLDEGELSGIGNAAQLFDLALPGAGLLTGLDVERDFIVHLEGNLVIGLGDYNESPNLGVALSFGKDAEDAMQDTLAEALNAAQLYGLGPPRVERFSGAQAWLVDASSELRVGAALNDGWLTAAAGEDWLREMMAASAGERENLKSNIRYSAASEALPAPRHFEMFLDLQKLLKSQWIDGAVPKEVEKMVEVEVVKEVEFGARADVAAQGSSGVSGHSELYGDMLGALLARDDGDERYWRMRSILTVWPGDKE